MMWSGMVRDMRLQWRALAEETERARVRRRVPALIERVGEQWCPPEEEVDTTWKALPADLLWQNKTTLLGSGYNPLDSFFPFDPCLLRRLNASIDGGYRLWRGIPGIGDAMGPKAEILDTGHRGGIPLPQQFQEAPDVITEDVSIESSSMASSLAYTYTDGIAMSLASNGSYMKNGLTTFSPSSYSDMMSAGSFMNGNVLENVPRVLEKRPRQFSVGSAGSW